jgi:hypothetical protein
MKIIASKSGYNPTYIIEATCWEVEMIVGGRFPGTLTMDNLTGHEIAVGDLWNRLRSLEQAIKSAGADAPRNLRSLADLLETQVQAVVPSKEDQQP